MKPLFIVLALVVSSFDAAAQNWFRTKGPVEDRVLDLCIDSNGILYAATPLGINRSTNDGVHWTRQVTSGSAMTANHVIVAANGNVVFSDDTGIFVSTDKGETFQRSYTNAEVKPVSQFAISGRGKLFACGEFGLIYSVDHGVTWYRVSVDGGGASEAIYAVAAAHDTIIIQYKGLNVSWNNGETWQPANMDLSESATKLCINADGSWLILTRQQIIRQHDHSGPLNEGWESIIDQFPGYKYFNSCDRTEDGALIISSATGLWLLKDYAQIVSINSGLEEVLGELAFPTRVAFNRKNGLYYVATDGAGVWKGASVLQSADAEPEPLPFTVSPNPFTDQTTIRFISKQYTWSEIELRNVLGAVIWKNDREYSGTGALSIDVSDIPAGNYLLVLRTSERTETQWVTIVK